MLGKKADAEGSSSCSSSSTEGPRWHRGTSAGSIAKTWTWGTEGTRERKGSSRNLGQDWLCLSPWAPALALYLLGLASPPSPFNHSANLRAYQTNRNLHLLGRGLRLLPQDAPPLPEADAPPPEALEVPSLGLFPTWLLGLRAGPRGRASQGT